MPENLTPRQVEFGERFAALMTEFHDVVGPVDNEEAETLDAEAIAALPALDDAFLSEWMIISVWSDMGGTVYHSKYVLPGMAFYRQLGVLHQWIGELMR
jgi:hypothetical protein